MTLTATFSVPTGYTTPNPVVNTATVSSTTADPVPGNNGSSVSSGIACGAVTGSVTGGGTACAGTPSVVIVTVAGGTPPYTVSLNNGGGTQTGTGPTFTFTVTPAVTTVYSVFALADSAACTGTGSGSATVTVLAGPATPTASSNSPVAEGGTINLTATTIAGATYAWTGPNGFASTEQNPTIPNATAAMGGIYRVTATSGSCTSPVATTIVTIPVEHDVVPGQWTWVGGSEFVQDHESYGIYGTKGSPHRRTSRVVATARSPGGTPAGTSGSSAGKAFRPGPGGA